jgi:DTW domain
VLIDYLKECAASLPTVSRIKCPTCNASVKSYCFTCVELYETESLPLCIQKGSLDLPFGVDFILDDRRASATGIPVMTLLRECSKQKERRQREQVGVTTSNVDNNNQQDGIQQGSDYAADNRLSEGSSDSHEIAGKDPSPATDIITAPLMKARLFDYYKGQIPDYTNDADGTYLLFPDSTSVPLSSLDVYTIKRLVLLDCKWSRTSTRMLPSIASLPKVHLDQIPSQSFYWRWHNSGEGRLCTVEALYYAAYQVASQRGWSADKCQELVHLLCLFGRQRETIRRQYELDGGQSLPPHLPFTEDGKQYQRDLRKDNRPKRLKATENGK